MLRLVCVFLGCDLPIWLQLKLLSSEYDDRLEDFFHQCTDSGTSRITKYPVHYPTRDLLRRLGLLKYVTFYA